MEAVPDDRFVVFALTEQPQPALPETVEEDAQSCPTYQAARRFRRAYHAAVRDCIIRFVGTAGGGD